jgi:hypothetical protein
VRPNSPLFRTLINSPTLLQGTPAVEVINEVAPRPDEPVIRGQASNGFDGTALGTVLRVAGIDTSFSPVLQPTSPSNPPRALRLIFNTGRSSSPTHAPPTATRLTPARSTRSKSGSARRLRPTRSLGPWALPAPSWPVRDLPSRGAEFITEPKDKYDETRCYIRDPDGYIEVGQAKPGFTYGQTPRRMRAPEAYERERWHQPGG